MVGEAKELLTNLAGDSIFAFRAGGWCLQPFSTIAPALLTHGIWLDSTVFAGGVSDDKNRWFDFSAAPLKDHWCFNLDPNSEDPQGPFIEVPISAMRVSPLLFWRMALSRKILPQKDHKPFGDGSSLAWGSGYYLQRLTRSTVSVASMDGLKAGLLGKALRDEQDTGKQLFHAMGHPKATTRYSLTQLDKFLAKLGSFTSVTFQDFKHLQPKADALLRSQTEKKGNRMNPKALIMEEAARFPTVSLFDIPIKAMTMAQALDLIDQAISASAPLQIGVVNAAKVVNMYRNPALGADVLSSDIIFADGASVVWASHILGNPLPERVAGIDLMMGMLERGQKNGYRVYLFGATEEVNRTVAERIATDYPGVIVAGRRNGYFSATKKKPLPTILPRPNRISSWLPSLHPKKNNSWPAGVIVSRCRSVTAWAAPLMSMREK